MSNCKALISLCFVACALIGLGCDSDHPDLMPGDQLGVDDLLQDPSTDPSQHEGGGQLIGGPPATSDVGTGGAGGSGGAGGGGPACGNGMIEAPEVCDGANMGVANCAQLGFTGGGTLLCDPRTCTFDDSMCLMGAGGVGGGSP